MFLGSGVYTILQKGGDFFELGQKTEPGKRNDLEQVKQAYKAGKTLGEIVEAAESFKPFNWLKNSRPISNLNGVGKLK